MHAYSQANGKMENEGNADLGSCNTRFAERGIDELCDEGDLEVLDGMAAAGEEEKRSEVGRLRQSVAYWPSS